MSSFGEGFTTFTSSNDRDKDLGLDRGDLHRPPVRPHRPGTGSNSGGSGPLALIELEQKFAKVESEKESLTCERDQALEDLRNVENSFSELHKRYERAKTTMENFKQNEELFKARDVLLLKKLEDRDAQLAKLKEEVAKKLELMYSDYEKTASVAEAENTRLRALVRKAEMKFSSLESDLEQKTKENAQLHLLCDDLINGKGSKG